MSSTTHHGLIFRIAFAGLLLAFLPLTGPAQQVLPETERASVSLERGTPLPPWADPMPLPPAIDPAPGAAATMRLAETQLHVGPPDTVLINRAVQVNAASALSQVGHLRVDFSPPHERLRMHELVVVRGDEVIDHTSTVPIHFLQRERALEAGEFTGVITASAVVPDLRVGDTLKVVLSIEGRNPALGPRYTQSAHWDLPHPVAVRRVTLTAPTSRPIQWRWIGGTAGTGPNPIETVVGGLRQLRFDGIALAAIETEPFMPPDAQPLRWLQFSEYTDWHEVALWAVDLFRSTEPLPDELAPLLAQWRAIAGPEERTAAALQWVQSQIRYWSVLLGEGSHRPQPPAEVLRRRYGDCKDKALLLARILGELGIEARPALVSTRTRTGPAAMLPTPEAFDHAIVEVRLPQRTYHLDATRPAQATSLPLLGQHLEDAAVLPVDAATVGLLTLRSPNRDQIFRVDLDERFALERLGAEGLLEMTMSWTGGAADDNRQLLQQMDLQTLGHFVLQAYADAYPGIRLAEPPRFTDDEGRNRIGVWARLIVPDLARAAGPHWEMRYVPHLRGSFLLPDSPVRQFPVVVPSYPLTKTYTVEMSWPPGVQIVAGRRAEILDTPHFTLEATRDLLRARVERRTLVFAPKVAQVPASELPQLRADLVRLDERIGGVMMVTADDDASSRRPTTDVDRLRGHPRPLD